MNHHVEDLPGLDLWLVMLDEHEDEELLGSEVLFATWDEARAQELAEGWIARNCGSSIPETTEEGGWLIDAGYVFLMNVKVTD